MTSHNQLVASGGLAFSSSRFQYPNLRSVTEYTSAEPILHCSVNMSVVFESPFEKTGLRAGCISDADKAKMDFHIKHHNKKPSDYLPVSLDLSHSV